MGKIDEVHVNPLQFDPNDIRYSFYLEPDMKARIPMVLQKQWKHPGCEKKYLRFLSRYQRTTQMMANMMHGPSMKV